MKDADAYRLFSAAYTELEPVTAKQERQATLAGLRAVADAAVVNASEQTAGTFAEHDRQTEIQAIMRAAAVAADTDAPADLRMLHDEYAAGYERAKEDICAAILAVPNQENQL